MYHGDVNSRNLATRWRARLVCDLVELYRFLVDDCLIKWGQGLRKKDFVLKSEYVTKTKVVNRIYLDNLKAEELAEVVNSMFLRVVEIPKLRNGEKQTISTLIQEEAQLLAKYLRNERKTWIPRIPAL